MSGAEEGPVFITGLDGSGKTRLRRFLATSPTLSLTRRAELWTRPHRPHDGPTDAATEDCLQALLMRPAVAEMVDDKEELLRELRAGVPTHARLFALIHGQNAARTGASRWGEQDSQIERVGQDLLDQLPTARVIHLVADPLERLRALDRPWHRRLGLAGSATAAWIASVRRAAELATRHPARYRPVIATSLADVEAVGEILRFLEITDIRPVALGEGRRITRSTAFDRAFVERMAEPELRWTGYARRGGSTAPKRLSAIDHVRWGPALARYVTAMLRENPPPLSYEGEA